MELLSYPKNVKLETVFHDLYKKGVGSIMVEAGAGFAAALLHERLVDKCFFFIAPIIVGGEGLSAVGNLGIDKINSCPKLKDVRYSFFGDNVLLEGYL